jgi:ABC-type multidrug transport system fused ATPase/permease subunit
LLSFAVMPFFKLPKTLRWVGLMALFLLLLLNGYRLGIYLYFYADQVRGSILYKSFWMGFRFDFRIVASITLLLLLFSFVPGVHFFRRQAGKRLALLVYGLSMAGVFTLYALDLAHLLITRQRIDTQIVHSIKVGNKAGQEFLNTTPWITLALVVAVAVWLLLMLAGALHTAIGKQKSGEEAWVRIYWQVMLVLLCLLGLYGRLGRQPVHGGIARLLNHTAAERLALNPVQAVLDTVFEVQMPAAPTKGTSKNP